MTRSSTYANLETLAAAVACSQIVVPTTCDQSRFPAGFDAIDIAILDWIVAEARRAGRKAVRM